MRELLGREVLVTEGKALYVGRLVALTPTTAHVEVGSENRRFALEQASVELFPAPATRAKRVTAKEATK